MKKDTFFVRAGRILLSLAFLSLLGIGGLIDSKIHREAGE